jgi:hypothetical protein
LIQVSRNIRVLTDLSFWYLAGALVLEARLLVSLKNSTDQEGLNKLGQNQTL